MAVNVRWREVGIYADNFPDSPHIFLSVDFFRTPPEGFEIKWTDGVGPGGLCAIVRGGKPCHEACMAGVLVKLTDPQRVWRLTGNAHSRTDGGTTHLIGYEAVWPD